MDDVSTIGLGIAAFAAVCAGISAACAIDARRSARQARQFEDEAVVDLLRGLFRNARDKYDLQAKRDNASGYIGRDFLSENESRIRDTIAMASPKLRVALTQTIDDSFFLKDAFKPYSDSKWASEFFGGICNRLEDIAWQHRLPNNLPVSPARSSVSWLYKRKFWQK